MGLGPTLIWVCFEDDLPEKKNLALAGVMTLETPVVLIWYTKAIFFIV